jgi:hypothetical protein
MINSIIVFIDCSENLPTLYTSCKSAWDHITETLMNRSKANTSFAILQELKNTGRKKREEKSDGRNQK